MFLDERFVFNVSSGNEGVMTTSINTSLSIASYTKGSWRRYIYW